ncbi:MAG: glycosyltransferase family 2 protein [Candidatus Omnitrophota bacterium]
MERNLNNIPEGCRVAIIVLNWNGLDDTVECLRSLEKIDYNCYKVVLVDNGSGNGEGIRLKELFPHTHVILNGTNRGFAGGNNDGVNWAIENGFEYIVNLNNDCIVERDWLTGLVDGMRSSGADFASSRIMFYPQTDRICSDGDILFPDGSAMSQNRGAKYVETDGDVIRPVFSACGAGSIYSVKCLKEVKIKNNQYFDELYFAYYEDIDLGIRLNQKKYKGVLVSNAVVYHKQSRTAGEYSWFKMFHTEKNRIMNELLNYPIYLFLPGEIFFTLKVLLFIISPFFGDRDKRYRYIKSLKIFGVISALSKARLWIIAHLFLILEDRNERKRKGLISGRIIGFFCWNIMKTLR